MQEATPKNGDCFANSDATTRQGRRRCKLNTTNPKQSTAKRLFTFPVISSIALLVLAIIGIRWVVNTQRAPGAMTITEAQGMDMTTSKPPAGVQPVAIETATRRRISGTSWFPAILLPYTDEEVVSRVPGRLVRLSVYPGDHVKAGQLLGTLDAPEYVAQAGEAGLMARSKLSMATAAMREQQASQAMFRRAQAEKAAAESSIAKAQADAAAMTAERNQMLAEAKTAESELEEMAAAARYQEANLARQQQLLKSGAISLDELQMAQKERDMAVAKVRAATTNIQSARQKAEVAEKKRQASESEVKSARSMLMAAKADAEAARAMELKSGAEAIARKQESQAGQVGASGFAAMADFRNLRALSAGIVSERLVAPGTSVMPGQAILRLKVVSRIRVQAELPQRSSDTAVEGGKVQIEINKKMHLATITAVFPSVNDTTRTFKVEAILENSDGKLKSGSFARMAILSDGGQTDLVVRSQAIQDDLQGGHYVWLVKDNGDTKDVQDWTCTMHPEVSKPGPGLCPICKMDLVPRSRSGKFIAAKQTVTIGKTDGRLTQVLDGLAEGDQVVWAGFEGLQPGTPIKPSEWGATGPLSLPSGNGDMPGMTGMPAEEPDHSKHPSKSATANAAGQRETQLWTCTMHPEIVRNKPGQCPICKMDLVPKESK